MIKYLITIILIFCICLSCTIICAEPIVEDVIIEPNKPKVLDTINITATITGDEEIDEIAIKIQECDETLCMQTETYEMDLVDGKYTITNKLTYASATYFSYKFVITSNGNETETEFVNVTLQPETSIENNDKNGESNGEIPIYIYIIIIAVVIIAIIIVLTRKN